jgi:hypothetical protein
VNVTGWSRGLEVSGDGHPVTLQTPRPAGHPRADGMLGRPGHGRCQQGESPKSSDDLPSSGGDPWRGHELADAHGQQGRAPRIQEKQ